MNLWILIVDLILLVMSLVLDYTLVHACYLLDEFIFFFLLRQMTFNCFIYNSNLLQINEYCVLMLEEIIDQRRRRDKNVHVFSCGETSFFSTQLRGNSFLFQSEGSFLALHAFYHFFVFSFSKHQNNIFLWVCQCVHWGGDCKIKVCFDYYFIMNNCFDIWIYFAKWFRRYVFCMW